MIVDERFPRLFLPILFICVHFVASQIASDDGSTMDASDFHLKYENSDWQIRRDFYPQVDIKAKELKEGGLRNEFICELAWIPACKGELESADCMERLVECLDYAQLLNMNCKGFNCTLLPTTPPPTTVADLTSQAHHSKYELWSSLLFVILSMILHWQ